MNTPADVLEEYEDENSLLVEFVLRYTNPEIGDFLAQHGLRKSGTKQQLRERIQQALIESELVKEDLIQFLDEREPWGKQHIFLYRGPANENRTWRDRAYVEGLLTPLGLVDLLAEKRWVALPAELTLTQIEHTERVIAVTAVARREGYYHRPELDYKTVIDESTLVEYRAFVQQVVRNTVRLEWDLVRNHAMIQITQLPTGYSYEESLDEFTEILKPWLDVSRFSVLDLRRAIRHLHEEQEAGSQETRVRAIDYQSLGGRMLAARSGAESSSLFGEQVIDDAMRDLRNNGVGRTGNFYWLPATGTPIAKEVHAHLLGPMNRVNITTSQPEEVIRYVVGRVRHHCS